MTDAEERKLRRAHVRELYNEGRTQREIASQLGIAKTSVVRDLKATAPARPKATGVPPAPPEGNTYSLTHGVDSERKLAPLREAHAQALRRDYDFLDDRRLALLADRLARADAARAWLDLQGGVVRDHKGEVFPVVDRLEKWVTQAEKAIGELEAEKRKAAKPQSPLAVMQGTAQEVE
jgi:transposase-like protein